MQLGFVSYDLSWAVNTDWSLVTGELRFFKYYESSDIDGIQYYTVIFIRLL